jgi:rhamnopyranosyl-N-acetylglucosaminyl-diphospho-decaprenol beta-1,3/1,4-galactofuranosyltransferase
MLSSVETSPLPQSQPPQADTPRVAAIIVTCNRLELLKECVQAVRSQTRPLDEIIVINNASTDGTGEWLDEQDGLTVIHQANLGGAGGFHRGIKEGYLRGHDWFWCMDDDTIPHADALERLCATPYFTAPDTGYLGSVAQWKDGSLHTMNMWLSAQWTRRPYQWYQTVLDDKCVPAFTSSFVSILISRVAVAKVGLPVKEFFIWCDDAEYTCRISEHFQNYHVLDSLVLHKTAANKGGDISALQPADYGKLKYGLRNQVVYIKWHGGSGLSRMLQLAKFLLHHTVLIFKRRAPFFLLRSLWSGLFFAPRIEQVSKP